MHCPGGCPRGGGMRGVGKTVAGPHRGLPSPVELGVEGAITAKFSVAVTPHSSVPAEMSSTMTVAKMGAAMAAGYSHMFGAS